jgi:hypothetical protein
MNNAERKSIGFVSLGCPKALVDFERILTQLKIDGYDEEVVGAVREYVPAPAQDRAYTSPIWYTPGG